MKWIYAISSLSLLAAALILNDETRKRAAAAEHIAGIIAVAGLDGMENGERIRAVMARTESAWGGRITNVIVGTNFVKSIGTKGSRQWFR